MRLSQIATLVVLLLVSSPIRAADLAAGKAKAEACTACHGDNGISVTENTPSLAGQPDLFLQWQLIFFRAGTRKSEVMQPMAEALDNTDVRNISAYFASLAPPQKDNGGKASGNPDLFEKGRQAAAGRRCAACHMDNFAGTKAVARIAGQREDYLVKALHDYKSGARAGGAMAAMADVAYPLSEEEITALAHYLAHL